MIDDEKKLRALAATMSTSEVQLDPRLERYAQGDMGDDEVQGLRADADGDPDLATAMAMLAPLSDELQEKLVEIASDATKSTNSGATLFSFPRVASAALALAASATLAFLLIGRETRLPSYDLTIKPAVEQVRGDDDIKIFNRSQILEFVMRPRLETTSRLDARLYLVTEDNQIRGPLRADPEFLDGAVRWSASIESLAQDITGRIKVIAVVGRTGALPAPELLLEQYEGQGWRADVFKIMVTAD